MGTRRVYEYKRKTINHIFMIPLIFNYIKHWFIRQSTTAKLFIIICAIGIVYVGYISAGKAYYKYQYFKELEREVTNLKDSVSAYNKREQKLLNTLKNTTKTSQKKFQDIDTKLKQDEEIIDNSTVTDSELQDFLSKFRN